MKPLGRLVALCFFVVSVPGSAETLRGIVVGVADGDTITLLTPDRRMVRVRLAEIDAPELRGQPFGRTAKVALSSLVYRRQAKVDVVTYDRYGRAVAMVDVAGLNVNASMVEQGLAWAYVRYQTDAWYSSLQEAARSRRRGLWAQPSPVPPWAYRRSTGNGLEGRRP